MGKTEKWVACGNTSDFPENGGAAVKIEGKQIAVFNFKTRDKWYATDNECPHKKQMILSRGIIGSQENIPKVACPFHKKTFSLEDGKCLNDEVYCINTYEVKIENENVLIKVNS